AVALSVPGSTPKDAVSYTTTLTWVLSDTPGTEG
ncbi:WxL domain-containing protein, partial [Listeria monocytogenes]|nr:WxL domain-containing protein [Listeria monocytogenes]